MVVATEEPKATGHRKVKSVDALASHLASTRNGKQVVHCHGVFDLLHIGHIRHLEQAKKLGDVLVVTVTPDRYVNKGPGRPAFNEKLRAEAIAALDCVDFVSINEWPQADETIRRLRPHIFVKGSEYRDARRDQTGAISVEETAIQEVGGRLEFTEDITFSSSSLINQFLTVLPEETRRYLGRFNQEFGPGEVIRYLRGGKELKVLVVGDAIIDEYHYCSAIGKSSKEPILAVKHVNAEVFAGGILAIANHVAGFCDRVDVATVLGERDRKETFIREAMRGNVEPAFFTRVGAPTIQKRRFIDPYFFQKLFEVYEMDDTPLAGAEHDRFCDWLSRRLPEFDLVVVVDFGHGNVTDRMIDVLCAKSRFLAVNAQSNAGNIGYHTISKYTRADVVCLAENEIRLEARDRYGNVRPLMLDVARKLDARRVLVTRGAQGSLGYDARTGFAEVPALATVVKDRMGAGDTFLSVASLCAAQDAPIELVAFVGNAAGAQAVATVGHRQTLQVVPLIRHIECLLK